MNLLLIMKSLKNQFITELETIAKLCDTSYDNFNTIISFLKSNEKIKVLQKYYKYCQTLDGTYQSFTVDFQKKIESLIKDRESFYRIAKINETYYIEDAILTLQTDFSKQFILWVKAFNIEKTYRKCFEDKNILTFSHRISGWSNPEYKLSENFSVELKTNFGYGAASYFYVKIKYKNIDITPLSEWIDYEIAKFSEIIRYTKSFANKILKGIYNGKKVYRREILNSKWQEAIEFTKIACNCSLKDEVDFVRKYIIDECEKMVVGLENISRASQFTFKGEYETHYNVDKLGHQLMEFRGEKISGSLDFIAKILEFERITEIKSFILRIEECNKKVQPLLIEELKIIKVKLKELNDELLIMKPIYIALIEKNNLYKRHRNDVKRQLLTAKELDLNNFDYDKLNREFLNRYPEFIEFEIEFNIALENYKVLNEKIQNLNILYENIKAYNIRIATYFRRY